jgi:diaminohydroxyphosphoribosylaminopyrimidine deaminase/5-amino-6-(5-phosphoribosylamino)uracil reductase
MLLVIVEGGTNTLQHFIDQGIWDEARVLIGQKKLSKGKPAPKINKDFQLAKENVCGVDHIQFFKNLSSD